MDYKRFDDLVQGAERNLNRRTVVGTALALGALGAGLLAGQVETREAPQAQAATSRQGECRSRDQLLRQAVCGLTDPAVGALPGCGRSTMWLANAPASARGSNPGSHSRNWPA